MISECGPPYYQKKKYKEKSKRDFDVLALRVFFLLFKFLRRLSHKAQVVILFILHYGNTSYLYNIHVFSSEIAFRILQHYLLVQKSAAAESAQQFRQLIFFQIIFFSFSDKLIDTNQFV